MKVPISLVTSYEEYSDKYEGDYKTYFQLHIFSVPAIYSTYYDPRYVSVEQVKAVAENMLAVIRKNSVRKNRITMFRKENKYLISEDSEFIDEIEMLKFDGRQVKYDYVDGSEDFFTFLGQTKVDIFIRKALITIGAEELFSVIETHVDKLCKSQDRLVSRYSELRVLDKTDPHIKVEIYRIEKNYVPIKIQELLCHSHESFILLPEHQFVNNLDKRTVYILKDMATDKTIDGTLDEAIESIKYEKWRRKNPNIFDPNDLIRMELDNDDPDYLDYKDLVKNDEELEEGDDEYFPH